MGDNGHSAQVSSRKGRPKRDPNMVEILVIDDEYNVRSVMTEALTSCGYQVYLADGSTVVDALAAREYNLIITDLRMPVMDGMQIIARAREESPGVKIIVTTGYPSEDTLERCKEMGVDRYLVKPFSIGEIRQVARNVLRGNTTSDIQ
ncbi:MAG: response regulator [Chloroflexota bacterium]|nr:response regulator [Chloroflexota bacterium]